MNLSTMDILARYDPLSRKVEKPRPSHWSNRFPSKKRRWETLWEFQFELSCFSLLRKTKQLSTITETFASFQSWGNEKDQAIQWKHIAESRRNSKKKRYFENSTLTSKRKAKRKLIGQALHADDSGPPTREEYYEAMTMV